MARKIIGIAKRKFGPDGWRKRMVILLVLMAAAGMSAVAVLAVHDTGAFELEGNATNNPAVPGDDWDNVCHQVVGSDCSTTSNTTGATGVSWIAEANLNSTIFTGGGSKDPIDINKWAWKDGAGGLPDKDNLLHAFAVRYSLTPSATCPSGGAATCDVIYFGSDRFDNSGDAQQGFWFLQNEVGLGSNSVGGGTGFTGVHKEGDVLVISDFSNGGTTSTITVYKWDPTCTAANKPDASCGDSNLRKLVDIANARCDLSGVADQACGIVNLDDGVTSPWSFTDKSGNSTYLKGEFYEAGINLSTLGLAGECFATVVAETRSSTSTTATLKDFVAGGFGHCSSDLTTTPSDASGNAITTISIGAGSVDVKDSAVLTIGGAATWTGSLSFWLCGPSTSGFVFANGCAAGSTLGTGQGTQIGSSVTVTNATTQPILSAAATITVAGGYCWRAEFDSNTSGVPDAIDGRTSECFTVTDTSGTTSAQDWLPNDTATVTSAGGSKINGSVRFTFFTGTTTCTGGSIQYGPVTVPIPADSSSGVSVSTSNTTVKVTNTTNPAGAGNTSWFVEFLSSDTNVASSTHCESTTLSITN